MTFALEQQLNEGLRLCQAGAWLEAELLYRELTTSHADAPDAWNMYALVLQQQGRLEAAAQAAERSSGLRPQIPQYWLTRGNIDLLLGRYENARACFRRAVTLEPRFAEASYRLGLSYHRELMYAEAASAYRDALRNAPDIAEIHGQLAEALASLDMPVEAMQSYENAFRRDPDQELDRRGAFECLERLEFDRVPEPWLAELLHFFSRQDHDRKPYVKLGLKVLQTRPVFRKVLAQGRNYDPSSDQSSLDQLAGDALFTVLLRDCLIPHPHFERLVTRLREVFLLNAGIRNRVPLDFLCALSMQCFGNEYAFFETEAESAAVEALAQEVERDLRIGTAHDDAAWRRMATLGAYRPLGSLPGAERLLIESVEPPLRDLLKRSVLDMLEEVSLREKIPAIGGISDAVSQAVRAMYEEHPYPRWFFIDREPPMSLSEWLARELPGQGQGALQSVATDEPRILVAGCGTGKDANWLALNIAGAGVLGVDLSRASLAHAKRMAGSLGVTNADFRHGDILGLGSIPERFDVVVSTGVLHHMQDPQAGFSVVTKLLRPGGLLKIGLYSVTARHSVNVCRDLIRRLDLSPSEPDMRRLRQIVLDAAADSPLNELQQSNDFYSMSMCRDLLFHVQEHQFTVPRIAETCSLHGLTFLGMAELPRETYGRYRRMFPLDKAMDNLGHWHAVEQEHPATFSGMYIFWARKN